jgi:hypothetical protein
VEAFSKSRGRKIQEQGRKTKIFRFRVLSLFKGLRKSEANIALAPFQPVIGLRGSGFGRTA